MKSLVSLLTTTLAEWKHDKAGELAAALSFYTIFCIAPVILILLTIIGTVFDTLNTSYNLGSYFTVLIGSTAENFIGEILSNRSYQYSSSIVATVFSLLSLVLTSLAAFTQLRDSLNHIWESPKELHKGIRNRAVNFARDNVLMFFFILLTGILILISIGLTVVFSALQSYSHATILDAPTLLLLQIANFTIPTLAMTFLIAFMYKTLPDIVLSWKDVIIGALFTALLFTFGKYLISWYISLMSFESTYSTVGGIFALMMWIYLSTMIFYFGAEFTKVYACTYGSREGSMRLSTLENQLSTVKKVKIIAVSGITGLLTAFPAIKRLRK